MSSKNKNNFQPSPRKVAANRLNAQRSTGPRTPQGKRTSSRNSYKLGIFARQLFRPTEEGSEAWLECKEMVTSIYDHYQPANAMEELLVDKVVTEAVRFSRVLSHEGEELRRKNPFWGQAPDRLQRYQTAINRQFTKAIEQLEELQAARKSASASGETEGGAELDGMDDEAKNTVVERPVDEKQSVASSSKDWTDSENRCGLMELSDLFTREQCVHELDEGRFTSSIPNDVPQETSDYKTNPSANPQIVVPAAKSELAPTNGEPPNVNLGTSVNNPLATEIFDLESVGSNRFIETVEDVLLIESLNEVEPEEPDEPE